MSDAVRLEMNGAVATVTLDDQATLNALTPARAHALREAIATAEAGARAIVITGAGRGFCSGADLAAGFAAATAQGGAVDLGAALDEAYHPLVLALRDCSVPIVAAVNGVAAGIGCSLALLADLVIAAESARFVQVFRRIGLVPDGGSTWLLPRLVGRARAMELMLLGESLPAAQALDWGLINRVVPDESLPEAARALAEALAAGPKSLAMIRRLAWGSFEASFDAQLAAERDAQREAGRTGDFAEGVSAFFAKRPPVFRGE